MFGFILSRFTGLLSTHATANLGGSLTSDHPIANPKGCIKCVSLNNDHVKPDQNSSI